MASSTAAPFRDLLAGYSPLPKRHDECLAADGTLRPLWREFFQLLGAQPGASLRAANDAGHRAILDHEVNMNVYSGPRSESQPWPLDVIPLLIGDSSWAELSSGLRQRARLYDALLKDVYGPRQLLTQGTLPAALIMANPHFLRPSSGLARPHAPFVHTYAADVARSPDGRWWVIDDRLDAPSGLGYALQNRIIVRQVLTEPFHRSAVVRLQRFFHAYRDSLRQLTPHVDNPSVAMLTPGPANESYFEQSYLSRYLGYPLIEGGDLTTRDRQVFLRTVGGLKRIDVLLRRVDSDFCDPLELNPDSLLGVAGLVNSAQAGRVVVANQLGARALESTGLLGFLAPLARRLLGEDLRLPNAATWWTGQPRALDYVLANLSGLVIKPAFRGPGAPAVRHGASLSTAERTTLIQEIRARPWAYCGQERILLGTTPAWNRGTLGPVPYVLRVFLTWADGDYQVMPGGLTRVHPEGEDSIVSLHQGSITKDTWIIAAKPDPGPPLPVIPAVVLHNRTVGGTPSRQADHLFWLGRYLERTSQLSRALEKVGPLVREDIALLDPEVAVDAMRLVLRLQDVHSTRADDPLDRLSSRAHEVAASTTQPGSLAANLSSLSRILEIVKINLPPEAWQTARHIRRLAESGLVVTQLEELRAQLASLDGIVAESLPRDTSWRFLDLGRRLERAIQVLHALQAFLSPADAEAPTEFRLQTLLHLTSGLFTYRTTYQGIYQVAPVLHSLLSAADSPRSVRFQAERIEEHLRQLPDEIAPRAVEALRNNAFRLVSAVRLADPEELAASPREIAAHATSFLTLLSELNDRLASVYFAHVEHPA